MSSSIQTLILIVRFDSHFIPFLFLNLHSLFKASCGFVSFSTSVSPFASPRLASVTRLTSIPAADGAAALTDSMIDPWTVIGTTSAVLSFAEFAFAIVKTAVDINKSEDGASEDNKRLSEVTRNGQQLLAQMAELRTPQSGKGILTPVEESMLAIAEQCRLLGERIIKFLGKMQASNEGSLRSSLKAAAKEVWYKSTVKGLNEQLHSCRTQLNTHLLVVVQ